MLGNQPQNIGKLEEDMSDVVIAHNIIMETWGHGTHKEILRRVSAACAKYHKNFSYRKLRSFLEKEPTATVRYSEMVDLAEVAMAEKARLQELERKREEARKSHAAIVAESAARIQMAKFRHEAENL